ncbi:MAG: replication factor C large subunit, partial [Thermoplasmata archaeon]
MIDWTEKYRPRTLDEVIGNDQAKDVLRRWADEWKGKKLPEKRGMIIYGRPGIGKTSSALALANEYGWVAIEMNASAVRNAENIK